LEASAAPPVYSYAHEPGVPPVAITRLDRESLEGVLPGHAHAHDFLVLAYFERGGGKLWIGSKSWDVEPGDAYVVAPGEVVGVGDQPTELARASGWAISFPPEGLGPQAPDALLAWRAHPLLLPFARGGATAAQRLQVPEATREEWATHFKALERELRERGDGYHEAVVAHLTLLLVGVARLAADVVADLRLRDEPLLAQVFSIIEARFSEGASLKEVAQAVGLTPGHLTTVVRRKTGRTVQDWITERRMAAARRLLVETDETVASIGYSVGYRDPAYFARSFRAAHRTTPMRWRRAARGRQLTAEFLTRADQKSARTSAIRRSTASAARDDSRSRP
jgi:AraC family transcriptional regulator, transcriptional activator of pobA